MTIRFDEISARTLNSLVKYPIIAALLIFSINSSAQTTRCIKCNFGFDGEMHSDTARSKHPDSLGMGTDDWFNGVVNGVGNFPIDTIGAYNLHVLGAGGAQTVFKRQGWFAPFHKEKGMTWIWAAYMRDNYMGSRDSSCFLSANKNGQNPISQWTGGIGNVNAKSDLVDAAVLVARQGPDSDDSLFLFGLTTVRGNNGSRFFDFELFKAEGSYSPSTGRFSGTGLDSGHTAWTFVDTGIHSAVTSYGDIIVAVSKGSSGVELIDLRIWMRRSHFNAMTANSPTMSLPKLFSFSGAFNGPSGSSTFGYASVSYSGSGYICGESNDTLTYSPAPPWGSVDASGDFLPAGDNFDQAQLLEFALNLTRLGIDPYQFSTITNDDWCNAGFGSVMVKSRQTGNSFTSNMDDFVGPASFVLPELTLTADANNIDCINTTPSVFVTNNTGNNVNAYYEWVNTNAPSSILSNSTTYNPLVAGTYRVYASRGAGCLRTDSITLVVAQDIRKPVSYPEAFDTLIENSVYVVKVYGERSQYFTDSVMNLDSAQFGPSKGLTYEWWGLSPANSWFTSTDMNPDVSDSGFYRLIVTEPRNGCKDVDTIFVALLPIAWGDFSCMPTSSNSILLNWSTLLEDGVKLFELQRFNTNRFETIGTINSIGSSNVEQFYSFTDNNPLPGKNFYRIKMVANTGYFEYSDYCESTIQGSRLDDVVGVSLYPNPTGSNVTVTVSGVPANGAVLTLIDQLGRVVSSFKMETNIANLDVSILSAGIYQVKVEGEGISEVQKLIKN